LEPSPGKNMGRPNDAHLARTKERRELVPLVVGSYFTPTLLMSLACKL